MEIACHPLYSDLPSAIQIGAAYCCVKPVRSRNQTKSCTPFHSPEILSPPAVLLSASVRASCAGRSSSVDKATDKPSICTADELHYISVRNSDWRLALWRYKPSPKACKRNHPLLLLSGVGTNAIGYDLSPESSFARYMSSQGFDTWILEVRGAGLSIGIKSQEVKQAVNAVTEQQIDETNGARSAEFLPRLVEATQNSVIASQIKDLSQKLINIIIESQRSVTPQFLQERISTTVEDIHKQFDLIMKYDWDFDHYLEEDVPAAIEYIRMQCKPKDGKLLAIGHSMGGILLYAMLSRNGFQGRDSELAAVVTLASSLDYATSKSSLKLLLPLVDPTLALNVPVIPMGALLAVAYPLASRPPYILSWLNAQISAQNMMHPELFERLVLNNFCTVPSKLLLQLATVFQEGGLCDRSGTFFYNDHLHKSRVPVLALGGDEDLICPPEAVYETVKLIPENLVTYKVFGEPGGPHYAHYDLVGSCLVCAWLLSVTEKFFSPSCNHMLSQLTDTCSDGFILVSFNYVWNFLNAGSRASISAYNRISL